MTKHEEELLILAHRIMKTEENKRSGGFIACGFTRKPCDKTLEANEKYLKYLREAMKNVECVVDMRKG